MNTKIRKSLFWPLVVLYRNHISGAIFGFLVGLLISIFASTKATPVLIESIVWATLFSGIGILIVAMCTGNHTAKQRAVSDPGSSNPVTGNSADKSNGSD